MKRAREYIALTAAISLVALQSSGLHMHVSDEGYVGLPEGPHSHSHSHDHSSADRHDAVATPSAAGSVMPAAASAPDAEHEHDYGDARDVSLVDIFGAMSKLALVGFWLALLLPLFLHLGAGIGAALPVAVLSGRRTRWRPPLRAPPAPA